MFTTANEYDFVKVVTQVDEEEKTYTLKVNKNMDPKNREWVGMCETKDALEMYLVVEDLIISLIKASKGMMMDYGYDRGWDAAFVALRRAGCLEMEEEHDEIRASKDIS